MLFLGFVSAVSAPSAVSSLRPVSDANGQRSLVELYDRQTYLSHLQAGALPETLGRSLDAVPHAAQQAQDEGTKPEAAMEEGVETSWL